MANNQKKLNSKKVVEFLKLYNGKEISRRTGLNFNTLRALRVNGSMSAYTMYLLAKGTGYGMEELTERFYEIED